MSVRRWGWLFGVALLGMVSGCTPGAQAPPAAAPTTRTSTAEESAPESPAPSITRKVPPEQRKKLAELPADQLCGLVDPGELSALAFPVDAGKSREIGFDPQVRGCSFEARNGKRSVLIGAQPEGFAMLGRDEVNLGTVRGTQTMHASDCTVFAGVAGATLQISVTAGEADTDQCAKAQLVTQYVLAALVV
ncbi:DUF3558 family protein [Saccharopolyspora phatthalungensis]|uniref:DUF3558 domain-containing protein n=1 Tax=Saccharopolyspora phatthalungensis TaxID=664693 RepID=A0A840Q3V0_9PSEU|nr:DUF3558 family protein [Saccharopolyspora phatthalungensis]MBB5154657.1 hypothetical protein [Saccharopolyspora phatthalungensis]